MAAMERNQNSEFWDSWGDRFTRESDEYITPYHPAVIEAVGNVEFSDCCMDWIRTVDMWEWVKGNINYKLSREWKEPAQTLSEGVGDCEDLDFLLASMMLNDGVQDFELVIGYIIHKDGREEEHTWLRMNDMVIEPTTLPERMNGLKYKEVKSFLIRSSEQ